jgi:hypothetical protein
MCIYIFFTHPEALGMSFRRIRPMLTFTVKWAIIPVKPMTLGFLPYTCKNKHLMRSPGACAVTNSL